MYFMKKKKILTTTIGSFPKPKYLPIYDWFDSARDLGGMNTSKTTVDFTKYFSQNDASHEKLFIKAAKEVIALQVKCGIDIPTDGEVRRENYIHYHCRYLSGFDFLKLEHRVLRDGAYETNLPAIRGKIEHYGNLYAAHDFIVSQSTTNRPVKFTLPGPLTIMDTNADCYYNDRKKLNKDLANTINKEILSLVEAGCKYVQLDEPLFARQVGDALTFGIEGVERCFFKVPNFVTKIVHICCGYTDRLDDENYKKADPLSYFDLAKDLDKMNIDQISIEDAHFKNDLNLLNHFTEKKIIFGALNVTRSRIETKEEIVKRLKCVLNYIDRDRLIVSPDCGLGFLSTVQAEQKLKVMCQAVKEL